MMKELEKIVDSNGEPLEIVDAEAREDISEIKQSISNLGIVAHTVVSETSINTVQTNTYGTLLSRKFSDYSLLLFMVLNTDNDMRGTSIIPTSLWTTDKQISISVLHGTASADARDFKVSTVTFKYASDSGVHMWTANNGAFTRVKIMGIKLG